MKRTAALFLALVFALNLTLPLSASAEEERVEIASLSDFLAFAAACLLPELSYSPKAENHSAKLVFRARPDGTGALFTFSVPGED